MNFFESQDTAKRNTGKLIFLFVLAVLSLIVITNVLVMVIFGVASSELESASGTTLEFNWTTFVMVGGAVAAVIVLGSLYKISSLSGGGARIAEMMNGKLLVSGVEGLAERRVLNVVEEMAIASGTPVPPVYLMEEAGINAFAAGYTPSDAVIGITRGAIETLSRDQLQGVIAHEFSHILHGDMRINIRLIGVLHGIMILGIIGYSLMRGGMYSRRSKDSGGIMFLGMGLVVVGFVGTFFGNLIKAAVSRQREYLADASAVQYTRNPEGIGHALMKIATHHDRSYLRNPASTEISHTLFEEGQVSALGGLYATHPPLDDRIKAILPQWDGDFTVAKPNTDMAEDTDTGQQTASDKKDKLTSILTGVLVADRIINQVGNPDEKHLQYADKLLHQVPEILLNAAHEPFGARAVIYLLVLSQTDTVKQQQLDLLAGNADPGVHEELQKLMVVTKEVDAEQRLPLVTIAISSLRQLSASQYQLFKENFQKLIVIDNKISLLEWALQKIVFHNLDAVFEKNKVPHFGRKSIKSCEDSCAILLSIIVHSSSQNGITKEQAYLAGAETLKLSTELIAVTSITFEELNAALDELAQLKPLQKPALLKACVACIAADGNVEPIEAELLRAVAATIDCPIPPLLVD
ncbi:MAG: heat-shock protein HtpX [SAR86 cluster bacterium]|uniref:Heat-shock protein HtpX n=1 Tax=SAR86 cluster bacterium TaxID=2030880 RepID=A0A2A5AR20_9GAMM|nr:MAG: heat-shock protein HtpX [SAR86 cluster bacterium]